MRALPSPQRSGALRASRTKCAHRLAKPHGAGISAKDLFFREGPEVKARRLKNSRQKRINSLASP